MPEKIESRHPGLYFFRKSTFSGVLEFKRKFDELESEHMDLLVLLANQEIEKNVILNQVQKRFGAAAEEECRSAAANAVEEA